MLTNNSLKLNRTNVILLKGKNIKLKTKKKRFNIKLFRNNR